MTTSGTAPGRLKALVERIERLNEDLAAVKGDIKEVFAEAGADGFNPKIIRLVIKLRATDKAKRQEEAALIDLYMSALEGGGVGRAFSAAAQGSSSRAGGTGAGRGRAGGRAAGAHAIGGGGGRSPSRVGRRRDHRQSLSRRQPAARGVGHGLVRPDRHRRHGHPRRSQAGR